MSANTIFSDNFLLQTNTASRLYHGYAKSLPIIDYHNHLPQQQIAENKQFDNITQVWLYGDHYKWRAMRALGITENKITGSASDTEKFMAWATCLPKTVRNPLFHWSHMELQNPFGIHQYLNAQTASSIYETCNQQLQQANFSTVGLLQQFRVELVGTTDDPCDDLVFHQQIALGNSGIKVLPSFRPDKIFNIGHPEAFMAYLHQLENVTGITVQSFAQLLEALAQRVQYFHLHGCRIADHGLAQMPANFQLSSAEESEFANFVNQRGTTPFSNPSAFAGAVLLALCKMYHAQNWVQQFHLGAIRNTNTRLLQLLGADAGVDSIGDDRQANALAAFLNALDKTNQLAKTILYNLNPAYNDVFATMCGNFQDGETVGKIQFGSGWWFLDQKDGIEKQLDSLSNMGILSTFVGMTTDSRSFLSYSRHDYFRRIVCNIFGNEMEAGLLPNDELWIGEIVQNICYFNAKKYF